MNFGAVFYQFRQLFLFTNTLLILDLAMLILAVLGWGLSFFYTEMWFLGWLCLAPYLAVIRASDTKKAICYSIGFGYLTCMLTLFWTLGVQGMNFINLSIGSVVYGVYTMAFGLGARLIYLRMKNGAVITVPALWVVIEYARTHAGFLSWPFGVIGYSQYGILSVARAASFAGVHGVSFMLVCGSVILAEVVRPYYARLRNGQDAQESYVKDVDWNVVCLGGMCLVLLLAIAWVPGKTESKAETVRVSVVQGGIYWLTSQDPVKMQEVYDRYAELTRQAALTGPSLVIWPSSSVPGAIPGDRELVWDLGRMARKQNIHLIVGSVGMDKFREGAPESEGYSNSAFHFSTRGRIAGRYDKIRLLPFDEYLPLKGHVKWPEWIVKNINDSKPGSEFTIFKTDNARFSTMICWENMFPDQFRRMASAGVDFMVVMTNDAFTDSAIGHRQMYAMTLFRAIENNIPVVRASTTGISGVIGSHGNLLTSVRDARGEEIEVFGFATADIPLADIRSFYNKYGDVFVYGMIILVLISGVQAVVMECRSQKSIQA